MAEEKVEVTYAHYSGDHQPGDKQTVTKAEAKALIQSGVVERPNKTTAKAVGVTLPEETKK
jgi:hypothetical protein